jgi:ABC-type sugar transport system ATPase subunit
MTTTTRPVLQTRDVGKAFSGVQVLKGVSLEVHPGEVLALLGENGAGKSTLLKAIFGVHAPDQGEIRMYGEPVRFGGPSDALRSGIAMVHQELSLVPQMTAVQNIVLGQERTRAGVIDWAEARSRAKASLDILGFTGRTDVPVRQLSIAQQQFVELARALSTEAKLIILDEPTAALTTQESDQLFAVIRRLRETGVAIIYVSHRLKEVLDLCDRVAVLRDGELVGTRRWDEITGEDDLVRLMVGRNLDALGVAPSGVEPGEEALRVEGVSVPGVLHDVSLTVRRGEVVGLAGMVGAGRTELGRALFGADRISAGSVYVHGRRLTARSPRDAIKAGIAFLPEDRKAQGLVLHMSSASNATLVDPPTVRGVLRRRRQREVTAEALSPLNARIRVGDPVRQLSGGTQQKVVLARWLLTHSDIFIFDEPTRGIDVGAKGEIHALMRRLADDGKAVLMISSDLPEVLHMSDRILVMRRGRVVAEIDRADASEEEVVRHAAAD